MKKALLVVIFFTSGLIIQAQSNDENDVRSILREQTNQWNAGDIDNFMKGYWNSDSLMFVGKNGVVYGYRNTLSRYKTNYDSPDKMGKLSFDIQSVKRLNAEYYHVLGKWTLNRKAGDVSGYFTLLFRKIAGKWLIVSDHSS